MTILIVRVVPQGIILGADRNITEKRKELSSGQTVFKIYGQSQRPKVLRWPNKKALVGYAGVATIGGSPADEWLYDFIGENITFSSLESLAKKLKVEVEENRKLDEGQNDPDSLIIHIAGFEERSSYMVPVVWFIRNTYALNRGFYSDIRKEFECGEVFPANIKPLDQIKNYLSEYADQLNPIGFQQGVDLESFNSFDFSLKFVFSYIYRSHPDYPPPQSLNDWEKHVKMSILTFGAFFETYNEPGKQYVGGGADIVSLKWPDQQYS